MSLWPAPAASRQSLMSIATVARRKCGPGHRGRLAFLLRVRRRPPPIAGSPVAATCFRVWACARREAFPAGQTKALSRYSGRRRARVGTEREGPPLTFRGGRPETRVQGLLSFVKTNGGANSAHRKRLIKVNLNRLWLPDWEAA